MTYIQNITHVRRSSPRDLASQPHATDCYSTKKLDSLLDDTADMKKRKHLATRAFHAMWKIWLQRDKIKEDTRLRLYNCYIRPVLTYNCDTWVLTPSQLNGLEGFRRHQLRLLLGVRYPQHISTPELYSRCGVEPLGNYILRQRWTLFGHILRRPVDIPANWCMTSFFSEPTTPPWRGRAVTTLPRILQRDLQTLPVPMALESSADLTTLRTLASQKAKWKELVDLIVMLDLRQATEDELPLIPTRKQPTRGPKRSYVDMDEEATQPKRAKRGMSS